MNPNLIAYSIHERAKKYGERAAYRYRNQETGQWTSVSWTRFSSLIKTTSKALAKIGVKEQDNVSIFSQNMPEIFIVDYGLFTNRAVSVPMYATSSKSQVEYIVKDAEVSLLFVGEQT
ncbi:MAG: AMP-binding protein, partial [Bacteroidales bacterium]